MIEIAAVGMNLSNAEIELMARIIEAVFKVEPRVIDIASDMANIDRTMSGRLIIVFGGPAAAKLYKMKLGIQTEAVPEPARLFDTPENEEARVWTWNTLRDVKHLLDSKKTGEQDITPQEILPPKLTRSDISELERTSPNGWVGRTKSGRSIRLSPRYTEEGSEDIKLTFAELYALRVAMELLEVTEFHLVPSTQNNPRSGR